MCQTDSFLGERQPHIFRLVILSHAVQYLSNAVVPPSPPFLPMHCSLADIDRQTEHLAPKKSYVMKIIQIRLFSRRWVSGFVCFWIDKVKKKEKRKSENCE